MGEMRKLCRMVNDILSCTTSCPSAAFFTKNVYDPGGMLVYRTKSLSEATTQSLSKPTNLYAPIGFLRWEE